MEIRVKTCVLGELSTNCYIVWREGNPKAVVIDPADQADAILAACEKLSLEPEAILLTHGHADHVLAADALRDACKISVIACKKEEELMQDARKNLSMMLMGRAVTLAADTWVKEGDILEFSGFSLEVMETPGHTAGSVCYYLKDDKVLFSGDTLFAGSYGRVDFPTSSMRDMVYSLRKRLFVMPDDIMVYPGHGNPTTIGYEKQYNPAAGR
ncbi:MAG: MBL fold metallo-hydrolase [bacterium]|nr:MBL fold metallo-hydrolase [bacterium]